MLGLEHNFCDTGGFAMKQKSLEKIQEVFNRKFWPFRLKNSR